MSKPQAILYVPGLGDRNLSGRKRLLSLWHFKDVNIELCPMNWSVEEPWEDKLQRLLAKVDQLGGAGKTVSLIGESAGASAVIQALARRSSVISSVVLLCGKTQYPERVSPRLYRHNPALRAAVTGSHASIREFTEVQKSKILNLHPIADPVVPVAETRIPGVQDARMPSFGHATSIVFANTLWSFRIVRFIRSQARK